MYRDKSLNQTNRVASLIPNTHKPTLYEVGTISSGNTLQKFNHKIDTYAR